MSQLKLLTHLTAISIFFIHPSLFSSERDYLSLLNRQEKNLNSFSQLILSPIAVYDGAFGGITTKCFWTNNKKQILEAQNSLMEAFSSPKAGISGEITIEENSTYTIEDSYLGAFFEAHPTTKRNQKKVVLDRVCVHLYPQAQKTYHKIQKNSLNSFAQIDRANALIALLEILEKNPQKFKKKIEEISVEIKNIIHQIKENNLETFSVRKMFIETLGKSIEGHRELRSQKAYEDLINSLPIQRQSFIPDERIGEFLSQLESLHQPLVALQEDNKVIWFRNLLWKNPDFTQSTHIEYQISSKRELCENYFSYSLPLFIHQIRSRVEDYHQKSQNQHPLFTTKASFEEVEKGIRDFLSTSLPRIKSQCQYQNSIQVLEKELRLLLELDLNKAFHFLEPNLETANHFVIEIFNGLKDLEGQIVEKIDDYKPTMRGDFDFIAIKSLDEIPLLLGRFAFLHYNNKAGICSVFFEPIFAGFSKHSFGVDNQFSGGCFNDSYLWDYYKRSKRPKRFLLESITLKNSVQNLNFNAAAGQPFYGLEFEGNIKITFTNYTEMLKDVEAYKGRRASVFLLSHIEIKQ